MAADQVVVFTFGDMCCTVKASTVANSIYKIEFL